MGHWDFKNIGASCKKEDKKLMEQLLECAGMDTNYYDVHGTECGEVYVEDFTPEILGTYHGPEDVTSKLFNVANALFKNFTIFYEKEQGSSVSDYYSRYEEIYKSTAKTIKWGEVDYCYGDNSVFGLSPYITYKEEIEKIAKERGIEPVWGGDGEWSIYPDSDDFYDVCEEFIDEKGGLPTLGTKKKTSKFPKKQINKSFVMQLFKKATKLGYTELAKKLLELSK